MDKIAKIKAEIERRYNECLKRAKIVDADYWNGKADAYRDIIELHNSLPEGQDFRCGECAKWVEGKGCSREKRNTHCITDAACMEGVKRSNGEKEPKEPKEIDFEKELRKHYGQVQDFTLCVNIAKTFYDKGYFDGHIHDGDRIEHVDGRRVNVSRFKRLAKPLEASVSENLKEFIIAKYNEVIGLHGEYDKTYIDGMAKAAAIECGMACAQWQKEKLIEKTLSWFEYHVDKDDIENYKEYMEEEEL